MRACPRLVTVLLIALALMSVPLARSDASTAEAPERLVEDAIDRLDSGDREAALAFIRGALRLEAETRSGVVNSLHLQSAALALVRCDGELASVYLEMALELDSHARFHDPLAFWGGDLPEVESGQSPLLPSAVPSGSIRWLGSSPR